MQNGIFKLDWASVADALITAVVAAILTAFVAIVTTQGFNVFSADWLAIGKDMVNLGFIAGIVSIGQAFLSTNDGKILGLGSSTTTTPPAN